MEDPGFDNASLTIELKQNRALEIYFYIPWLKRFVRFVESSIADCANKVLTHEEGGGNSGSTWDHLCLYIITVNAISLVLPTDIADIAQTCAAAELQWSFQPYKHLSVWEKCSRVWGVSSIKQLDYELEMSVVRVNYHAEKSRANNLIVLV